MKAPYISRTARSRDRIHRPAIEELDAALSRNSTCNNAEKIALMRKLVFASVDALEASGRIKIPD